MNLVPMNSDQTPFAGRSEPCASDLKEVRLYRGDQTPFAGRSEPCASDLKEVVDLVRMNSDQTPFAGRSEPSLAKRVYAQVT
jgi:hypothetical protein